MNINFVESLFYSSLKINRNILQNYTIISLLNNKKEDAQNICF